MGTLVIDNTNAGAVTLTTTATVGPQDYYLPVVPGFPGECLMTFGSGLLFWGSAVPGIAIGSTNIAPNTTTTPTSIVASGYWSTSQTMRLSILSKGASGYYCTGLPDNGTAGGSARGANCVDLNTNQSFRSTSSQVANGVRNTIIATSNSYILNTTSGCKQNTFIGGGNTSTTAGNVANNFTLGPAVLSTTNSAPAFTVVISGGDSEVDSTNSVVLGIRSGNNSATQKTYGGSYMLYLGARPFVGITSGVGTTVRIAVPGRTTSDATATAVSTDTQATAAANCLKVPLNGATAFKAKIVAASITAGVIAKVWTVTGLVKCGATVGTVALVGTPVVTVVTTVGGSFGAATITVGVNTTLGSLSITATGLAATTIAWTCQIEMVDAYY